MLRSVKGLQGYTIRATDGDIGHVNHFLFDDAEWTIRYVVVETGSWLTGRKVLISPHALGETDWDRETLSVRLTRHQVEHSPDIDTEQPVSRQQESALVGYYGWPYWWAGPVYWSPGPVYPGVVARAPATAVAPGAAAADTAGEEKGDPHLRSTKEVIGYRIQARDGEIGHVENFILDDTSWVIRYLVIDTGTWWTGKLILVPPAWIESVDWTASTVTVDLRRDTIKKAPEWDPYTPIRRAYEERLYRYYGRPPYW